MCSPSDIFLGIIAIVFPPLAVWIKVGICSIDSLINILLTTLGFLPGLIHAWYVIARDPSDFDGYAPLDEEQGEQRVTYYYVQRTGSPSARLAGEVYSQQPPQQEPPQQQQPQQQQQGYGAVQGSSDQPADGVPPTYEQAVRGDHKVQSSE
ncbi:MAG: hypothetical protein M1825_004395 [Sarcosagium campestre]|nr:MAG: hypothetical protein M1825_004395 [Sarcosagium campestre]